MGVCILGDLWFDNSGKFTVSIVKDWLSSFALSTKCCVDHVEKKRLSSSSESPRSKINVNAKGTASHEKNDTLEVVDHYCCVYA